MNSEKIKSLIIIACAVGVFISCKKKTVDNEVQSVIDNAICEQEFMRIPQVIDAYASQANGIKKLSQNAALLSTTCPRDTVKGDTTGYASGTYSNSVNLPVIELDYSDCADLNDGVVRNGKLKAVFTKPYSIVGSVATVDLINYKSGDLTYSGTLKITRTSAGLSVEVTDGKCVGPDWVITWYATRTLTWVSGMGDADQGNDVYEITGTSGGVNREGRNFNAAITSALVKTSNCKWIRKGAMEVSPAELKTRVVDFGDGTCDGSASFNVNGNSYTFNML